MTQPILTIKIFNFIFGMVKDSVLLPWAWLVTVEHNFPSLSNKSLGIEGAGVLVFSSSFSHLVLFFLGALFCTDINSLLCVCECIFLFLLNSELSVRRERTFLRFLPPPCPPVDWFMPTRTLPSVPQVSEERRKY